MQENSAINAVGLITILTTGIVPSLSLKVAHADENHQTNRTAQATMQVVASPFNGDGRTESTGAYTTDKMSSASGLSLSVRETPQSVSVITSQRIQDENMRSLVDAMSSTAGISAQNYDMERYSFSSRGFSISNYQYDGIPTGYTAGYSAGESSIDPIIYDRIEVVRGATGLLTGAGNPSASINMVRKHASSHDFTTNISASAGSWNTYRTTLDLSTPLSSSGNIRSRIVAAYEDGKSYIAGYKKQKKIIYGVIDADLSASTTLSAGFNYQDNTPRGSSWGGFPLWYADGGRTNWPRSLNTGADWTSWASTTQGGFITLKQYFTNNWSIQASGTYSRHLMDAKLLYLSRSSWPDRSTGLINVKPLLAWYLGPHQQNSIDVKVSGPFTLFDRDHEAIFGMSFTHLKSSIDYRAPATTAPVGNFLKWDGAYPEPGWLDPVATNYDSTRQQGWYGAVRLSVTDPLTLIAGGRYSQWKTHSAVANTPYNFQKNAFTPYAGLLYDFSSNYTAYLSYTSIFNPQSRQDKNGNWLKPLQGKSWETGIKGEYLGGKLNASIALFYTEQNNLAQPDQGYLVPGSNNQAYYPAQDTRSRGIDAEISGEITPGWKLAASYTYWNGQDNKSQPIATNQPRTLLRGFTTWQLPGTWQNLTIGGGINWQSSIYTSASGPNGNERVEQNSYALASLMSNYHFTNNFSAQLNIDNLFNRKYYSQIGFFSQGAWAAGRNVTLTMRYQY